MGKPTDASTGPAADSVSLHTNPGYGSESFPAYRDDDAPELNVDDLPPVYSDAVTSSSASELLLSAPEPPHPTPYTPLVKDANNGAEYYVDRRLETPEALEKHIRSLATIPPRPYIKITGTHTSTTKNRDGKTEKNTITDFDLSIDLTPYLYSDAQYRKSWTQLRTVDNGEEVRRGTILRKRASGARGDLELGPTASLEEWCHRFCASHAGLKCFGLQRQMTGFDFYRIKEELHSLVRSTNYRGRLDIRLETKDQLVEVYNEARTNRWRLTAWIQWMFTLTLLFIFSWPYLWLRTKRWEVAVADWPFSRIADDGRREFVTISEEQWYNMWGRAIIKAVLEKRQVVLDQSDLRRAQEPEPSFESGNAAVDGALGLFRAGISAMNEVNRQLGWGGDC
jgi:hypothetical protein